MWFFEGGFFYISNLIFTLLRILRERPSKVIIQLPQGILLLYLVMIKKILKIEVIADVHTGFLYRHNFKSELINRPFKNFLNNCDLILIHNREIAELLPRNLNKKTMVVYDPWYFFLGSNPSFASESIGANGNYLVIPCSYRDDEPIEEILESVIEHKLNALFYVTGN